MMVRATSIVRSRPLADEARDDREQRRSRQAEPESAPDIIRVAALPAAGVEEIGTARVPPRVPGLVDPVENPGKPPLERPREQQAFEPATEFGARDLVGIAAADGRQLGRVVHPGLEKGEFAEEFDAVDGEGARWNRERAHPPGFENPLMGEIVIVSTLGIAAPLQAR